MSRPPIYWVITDLHWYHDACIEFCDRPVDYIARSMRNLRHFVAEQDFLIVTGDVIFYQHKLLKGMLDSIPGRKFLTLGNHDHKSRSWYSSNGFDGVFECLQIGDVLLSHKPQEFFPDGVRLNIHGHWHREDNRHAEKYRDWYSDSTHRKLSIEEQDYKPVKLQEYAA